METKVNLEHDNAEMRQVTVLVVEPDLKRHKEYKTLQQKDGYQVCFAKTGTEAINAVYATIPDIIVADILLPDINGYQFCRLLKNDPVTQKIPLILVSVGDEKMDKFWGFKAGADAFIARDALAINLAKQVAMLLQIYQQIDVEEKTYLRSLNQVDTDESGESVTNIRTRLTQILDKALIESTLMNEFRHLNDLVHDKSLMNYMLFSLLESILDYDLAAIFYNDRNRDPRLLTFHIPDGQTVRRSELEHLKEETFHYLRGKASNPRLFDVQEMDLVGDAVEETEETQANTATGVQYKTTYRHDIFVDEELIGHLVLYAKPLTKFEAMFPVGLVQDEIKLLMKLRYLYSQAEILAITDGMTGLFNYRHFMMTFDREFRRARRYELDLSLAVIDIDNFKEFNDTWGHQLGDEVIRHIAQKATECFRVVDFVARYGGEEIVVIFSETPLGNAVVACERFRRLIEETPLQWKETQLPTKVSIGLASMTEKEESASDLIKKADELLYIAKKRGRNRVEFYPDDTKSSSAG